MSVLRKLHPDEPGLLPFLASLIYVVTGMPLVIMVLGAYASVLTSLCRGRVPAQGPLWITGITLAVYYCVANHV